MKNSLQETSLFEMHDPITPKRHDINIRKVNFSKKAKKFEYSANPTIVDMWSEQNRSQVAIQFISKLPVEILSSFILLYLRTVELCAVRSTCRSGWDCVATYAYENHIIPLCQGQYIAQCSSLGMMAGWEYEQAGFILQEWSHPHNRACQLCGAAGLDITIDLSCKSCNVTYHRACLIQDLATRPDGVHIGRAMLGDESEERRSFFCLECSQTRETPTCGFSVVLPPSIPKVFTPKSSVAPLSDMNLSTQKSPAIVEGTFIASAARPSSKVIGGSSMRLAIRESIRDEQEQQQKQQILSRKESLVTLSSKPNALGTKRLLSSSQRMQSCDSTSSWPNRRIWWDETCVARPCSFRVTGGFHSSSLRPNLHVYIWRPSNVKTVTKGEGAEGSWMINMPHVDSQMTQYTMKVPNIHSQNSCVVEWQEVEGDNCSASEHLVWTFPQSRDCQDSVSNHTSRDKEVCFHVASVLQTTKQCTTSEIPGQIWEAHALQGDVPLPRSGAAMTYSRLLGGILLHGGMMTTSSASNRGSGTPLTDGKKSQCGRGKSAPGWHYLSDDEQDERGGGSSGVCSREKFNSQQEVNHSGNNSSHADTRQTIQSNAVSTMYFLSTQGAAQGKVRYILAPADSWVDLTTQFITSISQTTDATDTTSTHKKRRMPTKAETSVPISSTYVNISPSYLDSQQDVIPITLHSSPQGLQPIAIKSGLDMDSVCSPSPLAFRSPSSCAINGSIAPNTQKETSSASAPSPPRAQPKRHASSADDQPVIQPSPRHDHSITEIGAGLWLFGGMGVDLVAGKGNQKGKARGRPTTGRRHLNDLYFLDLRPLLDRGGQAKVNGRKITKRQSASITRLSTVTGDGESESVSSATSSGWTGAPVLKWVMPRSGGSRPRRRAGHSAVAMGPHLIICGGANGMAYLFDMHILHTPTVTWSTVNLQTIPSEPSSVSNDTNGTVGKHNIVAWDTIISKRIRPGLLPVSPNQIIVFGGGKAFDAAVPLFQDIPPDCFLVTLQPLSRPAARII